LFHKNPHFSQDFFVCGIWFAIVHGRVCALDRAAYSAVFTQAAMVSGYGRDVACF